MPKGVPLTPTGGSPPITAAVGGARLITPTGFSNEIDLIFEPVASFYKTTDFFNKFYKHDKRHSFGC